MEKQIEYLKKLTDDFGMVQFSNKNNPNIKSGYTIDDVSRALIVSSKLGLEDLSEIYFNFIKNSQLKDGRFINVYSGKRNPLEKVGSQDSFGRTIWALGEYLNETGRGTRVAYNSLNALEKFSIQYPISESFALLGLTKMYDVGFEKKKTFSLILHLADSISDRLKNNHSKNWSWVSNEMSYENARIPQALFRTYSSLGLEGFLDDSARLMSFLDETVFEKDKEGNNFLNVIGNNKTGLEGDWYKKGSVKPKFDEQPVDAGGMVELHSEIYNLTKNKNFLKKVEISFDWFNGRNRLNAKMISPEGGVYDGLNENKINPNQGAESLLAYMMAKIKFDEIENGI